MSSLMIGVWRGDAGAKPRVRWDLERIADERVRLDQDDLAVPRHSLHQVEVQQVLVPWPWPTLSPRKVGA